MMCIFLGDVCYRSEHIPAWYLKQLNGRKHLIQGNHDGVLMKDSEAMGCIDSVDKMLFVKDCGERIVLCHFPIAEWNGFHKGAYHIYGHIHNRTDGVYQYMRTLERALNAGCMLNGYQPVTFKELIENNERYKDNLNKFRTEATHEMGYLRKNGKGILCPWKMKRKFMCCQSLMVEMYL